MKHCAVPLGQPLVIFICTVGHHQGFFFFWEKFIGYEGSCYFRDGVENFTRLEVELAIFSVRERGLLVDK